MRETPCFPAAPSVVVWYAVYVVPSAVQVVADLPDVQPEPVVRPVFDVQLVQPVILVPQHVV